MIKKTFVTTRKEIDDEVTCDCCGKSCMVLEYIVDNPANPDHGNVGKVFEYMDLKVNWGYHSNKDTQTWTAQVCESCVDTKLSVLINFQKGHYM